MEIMILLQIASVLLRYAGSLWAAYYLDCFIGIFNLAVTIFFIVMFEKEAYERTE